jgi:poly(hydroxyalkanoate) depolymerase family esterase
MNIDFQRLMGAAQRLTRAGNLRGATAAIQAALGGLRAAQRDMPVNDPQWVIDVEARELPAATPDAVSDAPALPGDTRPAPVPDSAPTARTDLPAIPPEGLFVPGRCVAPGGVRDYKLYVPPAYCGEPLPMVVMLHGCTQNPDDFAAGTGMNQAAREAGWFVLYPAQTQHANAGRCWNWFQREHQQRDLGEPALLASMTRELMQHYAIDPERIYVAGLSAGGAMAAILGQAYPELYAAVGVHSGLPPGAAHDLPGALAAMKQGNGQAAASARRAPPTIVFHGDADTTVHPRNGEQVVVFVAGAAAPQTELGRRPGGRRYTRRVYRDDVRGSEVEHWLVHGGGHAWSGGDAAGSYTDGAGPDATREMLRFFREHPNLHRG